MATMEAEIARVAVNARRLADESSTLSDEELVSRLLGMDPIPALQRQRLLNDPVLFHTAKMAAFLYRENKRLEFELDEARSETRRLEERLDWPEEVDW